MENREIYKLESSQTLLCMNEALAVIRNGASTGFIQIIQFSNIRNKSSIRVCDKAVLSASLSPHLMKSLATYGEDDQIKIWKCDTLPPKLLHVQNCNGLKPLSMKWNSNKSYPRLLCTNSKEILYVNCTSTVKAFVHSISVEDAFFLKGTSSIILILLSGKPKLFLMDAESGQKLKKVSVDIHPPILVLPGVHKTHIAIIDCTHYHVCDFVESQSTLVEKH